MATKCRLSLQVDGHLVLIVNRSFNLYFIMMHNVTLYKNVAM